MKCRKLLCIITAITLICSLQISAAAGGIVLRGNAADSEHIAIGIYSSDSDINNLQPSDILYINQTAVDRSGNWSMRIPLDYDLLGSEVVVTNAGSYVAKPQGAPVYVSATGDDENDGGSAATAVQTFAKALELVEDGTVYISGTVALPSDFVWDASDKSIMVRGLDSASVLDISKLANFEIGCNAIFDSITLSMADDGDGKAAGTIFANGNHVIVNESVNMNVLAKIYGGSQSAVVDSTKLELYGGKYISIFAGSLNNDVTGDCSLTVGGSVNSEYSVKDSDSSFIASSVNGAGWNSLVGGNCVINLKDNIKFAYVYGGSQGSSKGGIVGESLVNISGGSYMNVFACYNTASSTPTNAKLVMTGGTAEAVFGGGIGQITGSTRVYLLGGTVTRRVYGGCYNDWGFGWESDKYVCGSIGIAIGGDMNLELTYDANRGIFGGSRTQSNHADEVSTVVFLDNTYSLLSGKLGDISGWGTTFASNHDYIVSAGTGGSVDFAPGVGLGTVKMIPDKNYKAIADGAECSGEYLALSKTSEPTYVTFEKVIGINSIDMTYSAGKAYFDVDSSLPSEEAVLIVAVYDGDSLVGSTVNNTADLSGADEISIPCTLQSGKMYQLKAFIWRDTESLLPLCDFYIKTITHE